MAVHHIIGKARDFFLAEDPTVFCASIGIDDGTGLVKTCLQSCCYPVVNIGKGTGLFIVGAVEATTAIFTGTVGLCACPICKNSLATRSWKYIQDGGVNMTLGVAKAFPLVGNILLRLNSSRLS